MSEQLKYVSEEKYLAFIENIYKIEEPVNNIKDQNLIQAGQEILLRKEKDIYFIGDDNFIAITKYNRSHFYAKAVYDLSLEF